MKEILGEEEAKNVMENRFQIINIWRPLGSNSIMNTPLAICDYSSLNLDNDVHASKIRGSPVTGSLCMISHNSQDTQKCKPYVAQFGAHTAFTNEHVPSTDIEQCSIEVRCLVLYNR
ncbi:unnamed protein product [Rotaria sordida]|uniref:Uncharacterized protein n=1 Tax=Rotaria sordida TaxID=392033 RepID=A0A819DGN0_9BILA|nr:unnamed protein product [Rotaria sordida]